MNTQSAMETDAGRLHVAVIGFEDARQRVRGLRPTDGRARHFILVTEALWWASSVDEGLTKLPQGTRSRSYRDAVAQDPRGGLVHGLRYARNRSGHQRALATTLTWPLFVGHPMLRIPFPQHLETLQVAWLPASQLPAADPKFHHPSQEAAYITHLQHRLVEDTLAEASAWFAEAVVEFAE